MMILIKRGTSRRKIKKIQEIVSSFGYDSKIILRYGRSIVRIKETLKNNTYINFIKNLPDVENIIIKEPPYFLVSREFKKTNTQILFNDTLIGDLPTIIAGPCAVESYGQVKVIASFLRRYGVRFLRGGAYKPRTSPYSFQGLEEDGLKILRKVADEYGMFVVTEAVDVASFDYVEKYADIVQIGARNMQNFSLLKRAGLSQKPILLKRGFMSTIDEFLSASEYIVFYGNERLILCERGIRTYEGRTRFTLDISAIPVLKELTHLPVVVDPSHAAGKRSLVLPLARASLAAGADGVMIEVHNKPEEALSDGKQSLTFSMFESFVGQINEGFTLKNAKHSLNRNFSYYKGLYQR